MSWGRTNRSALIRLFHAAPKVVTRALDANYAVPDPSADPYLAFATMLAAGLDGIEKRLPPPPPAEENLYQVDGMRAGLETLPSDLGQALEALKQDDVIQGALGSHVYERYVEAEKAKNGMNIGST